MHEKTFCVFLGFGKSRMECSLSFSQQRIAPEPHTLGRRCPCGRPGLKTKAETGETVQKKVDMCIMTATWGSKMEIPVYI